MASVVPELPVLARDQAFESLYRRYVKDVYHYALALLRNPADAEDVTQTTFMNAYRAYSRGDEILKPQNWLIKIAHNVARTRYARASRRVKEVPLEEHVEQLAVREEDKPDVEGVLRALGRLPFNQRAALVMRELEGRSYAEIADTLNVSVSAVETLVFRARKSLRVRTSALRVLTGVPLPGSLASLFEGGTLAAGGGAGAGAFVGGGLLAKAVVALVVGAVATGVARESLREASAAPEGSRLAAVPGLTSGATLRGGRNAPTGSKGATTTQQVSTLLVALGRASRTAHPMATTLPGVSIVSAPLAGLVAGNAPVLPSPLKSVAMTATTTTEAVKNVATGVAGTVQQTAGAVVGALPVQIPSVPSLPAVPTLPAVPALPVVPALPAVPKLPAIPTPPAVPAVQAPPAALPTPPPLPVKPPAEPPKLPSLP